MVSITNGIDTCPDINVYLSRLRYVKDVTEHKPFWLAAQKILRVTYNWDYAAAVGAQKYLVEKGLIHFEDGLEEFIRRSLNRASNLDLLPVIDLFNDLLLSNADEIRTHLLGDILKRLAGTDDKPLIKNALQRLIEAINIGVFDVYRPAYFAKIFGCWELKDFDFSTLDLPDPLTLPEDDDSSNRLTLTADHQTISEHKVLEQVTDYGRFKTLLMEEDKINSSFNWHKVFEKLKDQLTKENVYELSEIVDKHRKESRFYYELSRTAGFLKDKESAVYLANWAIETSSSSGWDKYYDGGSRLNGFRALSEAEPLKGYDQAFDTFCSDILATEYTSTYAEALNDILPVVRNHIEVTSIYPEVESHAANLLNNATPDPDAFQALQPDDKPFWAPMLDFLIYLCHFPASPIRKSALQYLATHIDVFDKDGLKRLAISSEKDQELLAELLLLNRDNEGLISEFSEELILLSRSKNYAIENYALNLLMGLDDDFEPEDRSPVMLSPIYTMHLDKTASIRKPGPLNPEDFVEETEDVQVLTRALDFWISYIADHTPFEKINIQHRVYAVMLQIEDAYEWSADREKVIRSQLESLDVKTSFTRPRVDIVRRAVLHVMKELIDTGYGFDPDHLTMLEFKDPEILLIPKYRMPAHIRVVKEKHELNKDWIDKLLGHYRLNESLITNKPGWTIIGEYYQLKKRNGVSPRRPLSHS